MPRAKHNGYYRADKMHEVANKLAVDKVAAVEEELAKLKQMIKDYVPYVLATLPYPTKNVVNTTVKCVYENGDPTDDYAAVHFGRAVSSRNQLESLLRKANGS